jgi:DNA (cytosine-5)-methyltransferase 1
MLTIGSCCSGLGGLERGLEAAGLGPTRWQIEIDPFCRHVLRKHWPEAELYDDIRTVDASRLERVDLVAAGTPCQNLSSAGDRSGLDGPKSRLFYEFIRLVGALRPPWVCFENVASGASRWVDTVRSHLEQLGYATLPIQVAASDLGAPHIRSRVFIVANCRRVDGELQPRRGGGTGWTADSAVAPWHGPIRVSPDAYGDSEYAVAFDAEASGSSPTRLDAADVEGNGRSARRCRSEAEQARRPESQGSAAPNVLPSGREGSGPGAHEERCRPSGGMAGRYRRAALRALGNSCSPAQAEVVGQVVRTLLEAEAAA